MRHEQHRAVVAGERALELLDRLDVEVVRRLVEDEAVDAARGEQREHGARALARRQRRRRAQDVVCAEAELREQRARLLGEQPLSRKMRRAAAACPESAARRCSSSPRTTPGPAQRAPAASGRRPSSASSSVVLPLPFGPAIASRSPQLTSRSSGPSRNAPRSMTALLEPDDDVAAAGGGCETEAAAPTARTASRRVSTCRASPRTPSSRPSTSSSCGPGRSRAPPTRPCGAPAPRCARARRPSASQRS